MTATIWLLLLATTITSKYVMYIYIYMYRGTQYLKVNEILKIHRNNLLCMHENNGDYIYIYIYIYKIAWHYTSLHVHASQWHNYLLAPVHTIFPELNISAVVRGSLILIITAANRYSCLNKASNISPIIPCSQI